jgi:hypothetical protein
MPYLQNCGKQHDLKSVGLLTLSQYRLTQLNTTECYLH